MPLQSITTPRNSCLAAIKINLAKLNERAAASSQLSMFNVDVMCFF